MPAAAARGRKPAPANRSRQQLQREKALQLAAQKSTGAPAPGLLLEQQLSTPPPKEEAVFQPMAPTGAPAVKQELQQKPNEVKSTENHQPRSEEETPAVKELEKQEVELLVCLFYCPRLSLTDWRANITCNINDLCILMFRLMTSVYPSSSVRASMFQISPVCKIKKKTVGKHNFTHKPAASSRHVG